MHSSVTTTAVASLVHDRLYVSTERRGTTVASHTLFIYCTLPLALCFCLESPSASTKSRLCWTSTCYPVAKPSSRTYHMDSIKRSMGGGYKFAAHTAASKEARVVGTAGAALALLWMVGRALTKKSKNCSQVCAFSLSLGCNDAC